MSESDVTLGGGNHWRNSIGPRRDIGIVNGFGRLGQASIGGQSFDLVRFRMDRINLSAIPEILHAPDKGIGDDAGGGGGADDGDGLRCEERPEALSRIAGIVIDIALRLLFLGCEDDSGVDSRSAVHINDYRVYVELRNIVAVPGH